MASNTPPTYSEQGTQLLDGNAPPTYNDSTGVLDVSQDGFSTQTQVRGEFPPLLYFHSLNLPKRQMTDVSIYI
jgi:hypothetical protein